MYGEWLISDHRVMAKAAKHVETVQYMINNMQSDINNNECDGYGC